MNKIKCFIAAALSVAVIAGPAAAAVTGYTRGFAEATDGNKVSTDTLTASEYIGHVEGENTSEFTADGVLCTVAGADTVGGNAAWKYKARIPGNAALTPAAFSFKTNDSITLKISAKLYDDEGNVISKSQNSAALDIFVHNKATGSQLGGLRIWTDAWGANNGNHSYNLYGAGWDNYGAGLAINGDATAASEFVIKLDKTSFISSVVSSGEMKPLGTSAFIEERREALTDVDEVYFVINGENGFTKSTEITLKELNGQSLASSDGKITDETPPVFEKTAIASTVEQGKEFTVPVEAYDMLGDVTYSIKVGENAPVAGKAFTPSALGDLKVTLYATDAAGNEAQRDFDFTVIASLDPPEITSLPQIQSKAVDYLSRLTFGKPEFIDKTGVAETVLKLYKGEVDDENLIATLAENGNGEFTYLINTLFESGDYKVVYEVTNSAGTATSEPISVTYTLNEIQKAEFIVPQTDKMLADFTADGIRLRTLEAGKRFYLDGSYDVSEGFDFKFIVKDTNSIGTANGLTYVSWILVNVDNPKYYLMYRVWLNQNGGDRPCNVYVAEEGKFTDYTNMGWISRTVDGVDGQFHMAFDTENTFIGERLGGMTKIESAGYEAVTKFLQNAPSNNFSVAFEASNLNAGDDIYYEITVSEFNGQKFAAPITWNNAYLSVQSDVPQMIKIDEALTIKAYSKDIRQATELKLTVIAPDETSQAVEFNGNTAEYLFDKLGRYKIIVSTTGKDGVEVKLEYEISCKESVDPVTIEIDGEYAEKYDKGSQVTVLGATYSENAVKTSITVKKPDGTEITVEVGDAVIFDKSGIYTIIYSAQDGQTDPNKGERRVQINVPDTEKPVISVEVGENVKVNQKLTPIITITDDSACDVTVTLEKPDGTSVKLSATDGYAFTPDAVGEYKLMVEAEDAYGNTQATTLPFTVRQASSGTVWIVIGCVGGAVVIGAAAALIVLYKKQIIFKKGGKQDKND